MGASDWRVFIVYNALTVADAAVNPMRTHYIFVRVILLQDIENVGKKWDVKEVADGYAENFLFPKNLARHATAEALARLDAEKQRHTKQAEADLTRWQEVASNMDGLEITLPVKVSEAGTLYAHITPQKIAEALEALGYPISRQQVKLEAPLVEPGEYPVMIMFPHGLEVQVKIVVEEEKESKKE